ncbi:MAG: protein-glutamate methylesterase/protein-glutamine glutaminase [Candidatus Kryptoniota bacterium]
MSIRVLVVDDSAFMRKAISMMLETDPEIKVIATARDGFEAVEKNLELKPDIVTLDVEMPRMDGLTALKRIMKENPVPVLMVSSLTIEGARTTVEALEAGAVDFIPKQLSYVSLDITNIKDDLISKVRSIVKTRAHFFERELRSVVKEQELISFRHANAQIVVIGISTGGPFSLQRVIPNIPKTFPIPIAIVQHMPPHFTRSLAERLNATSQLEVVEAEDGMELTSGRVYIAPGGFHMVFQKKGSSVLINVSKEPSTTLHKPSVDVMFSSANTVYGGKVIGIIMTGMGKDGLEGTKLLKKSGARIIAQDEESCVVYGMPKAIVDAELADAIVPLEAIAETLTNAVNHVKSTNEK